MLDTEKRNPKTTHIDKMSSIEMVDIINEESLNAVKAVEAIRTELAEAVDAVAHVISCGGRLYYIGAGTSGRLGIVDASECPPTYGVPNDLVTGIIAGGRASMFSASENAEDIEENGRNDILEAGLKAGDAVVGISAAGGAAYVVGALKAARELGCITIGLTCNPNTAVLDNSDIKLCTQTGAEVITGSTRMKAGTAQKLVLNTISTCAMIKTGKVYENLMINLKPSNIKLTKRMIGIVRDILGVDEAKAEQLLKDNNWSIREAVEANR